MLKILKIIIVKIIVKIIIVMITSRLANSNSPLPMLKRLPPEASANALDAFAGLVVMIYVWNYS